MDEYLKPWKSGFSGRHACNYRKCPALEYAAWRKRRPRFKLVADKPGIPKSLAGRFGLQIWRWLHVRFIMADSFNRFGAWCDRSCTRCLCTAFALCPSLPYTCTNKTNWLSAPNLPLQGNPLTFSSFPKLQIAARLRAARFIGVDILRNLGTCFCSMAT